MNNTPETPAVAPAEELPPRTALVPLADGFEDIEAVAVIDVLRRGGVQVVTASLNSSVSVLSAHGLKIQADALLSDVLKSNWDAIILPGGGKGTENLMACEPLKGRLRTQREAGGLVCAICAAPTVLEAAGVLEEEQVTCYPTCADLMNRPVEDVPVIADLPVITGQAPGAAVSFALVVLGHLVGFDVAEDVADGMVTEI